MRRTFAPIIELPLNDQRQDLAVGKSHAFKKEMDEETKRSLFPSNCPKAAV